MLQNAIMNQISPDVTLVHFVVATQNQMPISPPVSENCTERTGRTSDAFAMTCGNSDFFHFLDALSLPASTC